METTLLGYGPVFVALIPVALAGLRLYGRGRRLTSAIKAGLPVGSQYEDEDADGSAVRFRVGGAPTAPAESRTGGSDG